MHHSGDYEKVIPAGWLPSIPERILPLFQVRRDKAGTALSLLGPISSSGKKEKVQKVGVLFVVKIQKLGQSGVGRPLKDKSRIW
jgi:hypothetical protein